MNDYPLRKLYQLDYIGDGKIDVNDCTAMQKSLASISVELYRTDIPFLIYDSRDTTPENIPFTFDQLLRTYFKASTSTKAGFTREHFAAPFSSVITTYDDYIKEDYNPQEKYNEEFFKDNALILLYRSTGSGSDRFRVDNIAVKDGILYIDDCYVTNKGTSSTCDLANYLLYVTVNKSDIENIDKIYITRKVD